MENDIREKQRLYIYITSFKLHISSLNTLPANHKEASFLWYT